jgi:GTPase SAR1 family protein
METHSFIRPLADLTGLAPATLYVFMSLGLLGVIVAALLFVKRDRGLDLETDKVYAKQPRDRIVIVGPVGSGKTQLFYKLLSPVEPSTVSSTEINQTDGAQVLNVPKSLATEPPSLSFLDIPGHFNFRLKVQQNLERAKALILVVDSRDKEKVAEAAEFLYDMLCNKRLVSD